MSEKNPLLSGMQYAAGVMVAVFLVIFSLILICASCIGVSFFQGMIQLGKLQQESEIKSEQVRLEMKKKAAEAAAEAERQRLIIEKERQAQEAERKKQREQALIEIEKARVEKEKLALEAAKAQAEAEKARIAALEKKRQDDLHAAEELEKKRQRERMLAEEKERRAAEEKERKKKAAEEEANRPRSVSEVYEAGSSLKGEVIVVKGTALCKVFPSGGARLTFSLNGKEKITAAVTDVKKVLPEGDTESEVEIKGEVHDVEKAVVVMRKCVILKVK